VYRNSCYDNGMICANLVGPRREDRDCPRGWSGMLHPDKNEGSILADAPPVGTSSITARLVRYPTTPAISPAAEC